MTQKILVLGATGRTGRHFVSLALREGAEVRALVRDSRKYAVRQPRLEVFSGSILDDLNLDELLMGVDCVVSMLGDATLQRKEKINTHFVQRPVPAMRRHGVKSFLYQAGGLTRPYKQALPVSSWIIRNTLARFKGLIGQHEDNEAVIEYLVEQAQDLDWIVHRASLYSDGPSKGILQRSKEQLSVASFIDCALYNYKLLSDRSAIHTCDLSCYSSTGALESA